MPRKTSFCNAALLRSDIKRYWPLLFLYVAVWVVILPMQILSASRECDGVAEGIMTVLQLRQHNVIIQSIPASVVMSLLFGCFAAMAVWSYLMSGRTVGLMHALPVTRTQAFFSHVLSALGALTAGNVLIFLLTALCSAGFSYVDWAALGTWLLLTELMALFFFALGSLCAMVTGWLLAVPVLYGAMNVIALLLYAVISTMTQMFYFGYSNSNSEFIWLTPRVDLGCRGQRRRPTHRSAVPRAHRHPKLSTRPAAGLRLLHLYHLRRGGHRTAGAGVVAV